MNDDLNAALADMQAQLIALRFATEGAWLSLLMPDPDPATAAKRLGEQNVAAIRSYATHGGVPAPMAEAVASHTEKMWSSVAFQLAELKKTAGAG